MTILYIKYDISLNDMNCHFFLKTNNIILIFIGNKNVKMDNEDINQLLLDKGYVGEMIYDEILDWLELSKGIGIETATDITLSWVWKIQPLNPSSVLENSILSSNVYDSRKLALEEALLTLLETKWLEK